MSESNDAISRLREGNSRFVSGTPADARVDPELLADLAELGQSPIAAVLACADSRVPVEIVFDCTVGELFVVRVAGNVVGPQTAGSIEYAVKELGVGLVVVLGHTGCGAVTAAMDGFVSGGLRTLVDPIVPACDWARRQHPGLRGPELIDHAVRENVRCQIKLLEPMLVDLGAPAPRVVGAVYELSTGNVAWLDPGSA